MAKELQTKQNKWN